MRLTKEQLDSLVDAMRLILPGSYGTVGRTLPDLERRIWFAEVDRDVAQPPQQ